MIRGILGGGSRIEEGFNQLPVQINLPDVGHLQNIGHLRVSVTVYRSKDKEGKPKDAYYACGWEVGTFKDGTMNTWHNGSLPGTSALLVRRNDGLTWAVLFNSRHIPGQKDEPADLIDALMHAAADAVEKWPK